MDSGIGIGGLSVGQDEYASDCFDLFKPIEIENSIEDVTRIITRPISSANSRGPFIFEIPADFEKFTDAESFRIHGRMRIRKKDAGVTKDIDDDDNVSTVNNIFDSLWNKVRVKVNDKSIDDPTNAWYAYKAYFENHLSYSKGTKSNLLSYRGYFNDTFDKLDDVGGIGGPAGALKESENEGFIQRKNIFAGSNWVYFCINLHSDITTLRKYIPTGVKLVFEFERNNDEFCLLSHDTDKNYFIELDDMRMSSKRYRPEKKTRDFYANQLRMKRNPTLPIDRSLLKDYVVNKGISDLSHYNLIRGTQLPEQIIIGIVDQAAHGGNITKNPFNFKHYGIKEASIIVNGVNEPAELYRLDMDSGDKVDMFANFLENTGVHTDDREFGISLEDYYGGSFLLAWDRTPDKCNRYHRHKMDSGTIDINIKTKTPLRETVTVIVYATYSSDIVIEDERVYVQNF